ncbi:MAG: hypothetical protein Q3976_01470 [Corynebacterium sp.]|nr:hypothetical protein [Corynebacterium sp.]
MPTLRILVGGLLLVLGLTACSSVEQPQDQSPPVTAAAQRATAQLGAAGADDRPRLRDAAFKDIVMCDYLTDEMLIGTGYRLATEEVETLEIEPEACFLRRDDSELTAEEYLLIADKFLDVVTVFAVPRKWEEIEERVNVDPTFSSAIYPEMRVFTDTEDGIADCNSAIAVHFGQLIVSSQEAFAELGHTCQRAVEMMEKLYPEIY